MTGASLQIRWLPWLPVALLSVGLVAAQAWNALIVLILDGVFVGLVVAAAAGCGIFAAVRLVPDASRLQRWCVAIALGLGVIGVATLALGMLGGLTSATAWAIVCVGLLCLAMARGRLPQPRADATTSPPSRREIWASATLLLPLAVPISIVILGVCLPPGILWPDEAQAYDALEYHLQAPREYFSAGRIHFLPHNVYASFPQQVEILFLLLMHLKGGAHDAAFACQLIHASLGALAVVAICAFVPAGRARLAAALLGGSAIWISYLGCIAYVENGVLLFSAVAAGLLLPREAERIETPGLWMRCAAAGLIAGLAGGCKYTALAMTTAPLGVLLFASVRGSLALRGKALAVFSAAALFGFAPWLIRNEILAGNPVFPFASEWFGGRDWSAEQATQWREAHRPAADVSRLALAFREFFELDPPGTALDRQFLFAIGTRFNLLLVLLAATCSVAAIRDRTSRFLAAWVAIILTVWILATHMPSRFVVVLVVPFVWLSVQPIIRATARWHAHSILAMSFAAAALGAVVLWGHWRNRAQSWRETTRAPLIAMIDQIDVAGRESPLNLAIPADARAWLVGDAAVFWTLRPVHYFTVFNRDPWLEYARSGASPDAALAWMRERGITHVVFNWREINRLRDTYGFSPVVSEEWVDSLVAAGARRDRDWRSAADFPELHVYDIRAQ